jgi:hypothetical protein
VERAGESDKTEVCIAEDRSIASATSEVPDGTSGVLRWVLVLQATKGGESALQRCHLLAAARIMHLSLRWRGGDDLMSTTSGFKSAFEQAVGIYNCHLARGLCHGHSPSARRSASGGRDPVYHTWHYANTYRFSDWKIPDSHSMRS